MFVKYDRSNEDGSYVDNKDVITAILATKFSTFNNVRYASFSLLIVSKNVKSPCHIRLYKGKYYSLTKSFKLADNVLDRDFNHWALANINKLIYTHYNFIDSMIVIQFHNTWDLERLMVSDQHYNIELTKPDGSTENIRSLYNPKYNTLMRLKHINSSIVSTNPKITETNDTNRSVSLAICMSKASSSINRLIREDKNRLKKMRFDMVKSNTHVTKLVKPTKSVKPATKSKRKPKIKRNIKLPLVVRHLNNVICPTCSMNNLMKRKNSKGWKLYDMITGKLHNCGEI